MLTWIKQKLASPAFEDEDQTRAAALLNTLLLTLIAIILLVTPVLLYADSANIILNITLIATMVVICLGLLILLHYGWVQLASILLLVVLLAMITLNIWFFEGSIRGVNTGGYFMIVIIAGLLLGGRAAIIFGVLSILTTLGLYYAETGGIFSVPSRDISFSDWIVLSFLLVVVALDDVQSLLVVLFVCLQVVNNHWKAADTVAVLLQEINRITSDVTDCTI